MRTRVLLALGLSLVISSAAAMLSQVDSDGDGVDDALDACPNTPLGTRVTVDGCPNYFGIRLQNLLQIVQSFALDGPLESRLLAAVERAARFLEQDNAAGAEQMLDVAGAQIDAAAGQAVSESDAAALARAFAVAATSVSPTNVGCALGSPQFFSAPLGQCAPAGGAVTGLCLLPLALQDPPPARNPFDYAPGRYVRLRPTDPAGAQRDWYNRLLVDVLAANLTTRAFGGEMEYIKGLFNCNDFSRFLEHGLTQAGYDASFTVYWCDPPNADSDYPRSKGHAIVDVHAPDGSVTFIDPQSGQPVNMDFDGDGSIGAATDHKPPSWHTDDRCRIEIYDNYAAAIAAGVRPARRR